MLNYLPLLLATGDKVEPVNNFVTNSILQNIIAFLAPLVGIAMVVFCVIQAFKLIKGSEGASIMKLFGGIGIFLILLGIMYAAGSFKTYGQAFQSLTNTAIEQGTKDLDDIID